MTASAARQLHFNVNVLATGRHTAAWRRQYPNNPIGDIDHYLEIARTAERGTLDAMFFADHPALDEQCKTRPWHALDPVVILAAMASVTRHVGLMATATTTFEHPYFVARRFASLDHISKGRAAWNIVTTQTPDAAGNFGLKEMPAHGDRYARAEEFVEVVCKLWDSWDDDAVVADPKTGQFVDMSKVHPIDHVGAHFSVTGPLNLPRAPQGRPVLVQAGASDASRGLGSRWADVLFTIQRTIDEAREAYADVKSRARAAGRNPDHLVVLPGLYVVVGSTEEEALARKKAMDDLVDLTEEIAKFAGRFNYPHEKLDPDKELPGDFLDHLSPHVSRGMRENIVGEARRDRLTLRQLLGRNAAGTHRAVVGTPEQIADDIEFWFKSGAADGFNLQMDSYPAGLGLFVDQVVPELRRRGIFRHEYAGTTLRENLGIPRPSPRSGRAAKQSSHEQTLQAVKA